MSKNKYIFCEDYVIGYSITDNSEFYFDKTDYDLISQYNWHNGSDNYISTSIFNPQTKTWRDYKMHQLLVDYTLTDHIDRNQRNNRRNNLRPASNRENSQNISKRCDNTSGIIGVTFDNRRNSWVASITVNGKHLYLKSSKDKETVIKARLEAEKKYFGEFAPQKHLFEQYQIE
ncbi:MAG: hypothetical protein DBY43_07890 [Clostridiaceae bacterium]|nr:MAG: hypothetical protein DBY43_07890 [Clostridiaceae bacterium]